MAVENLDPMHAELRDQRMNYEKLQLTKEQALNTDNDTFKANLDKSMGELRNTMSSSISQAPTSSGSAGFGLGWIWLA